MYVKNPQKPSGILEIEPLFISFTIKHDKTISTIKEITNKTKRNIYPIPQLIQLTAYLFSVIFF